MMVKIIARYVVIILLTYGIIEHANAGALDCVCVIEQEDCLIINIPSPVREHVYAGTLYTEEQELFCCNVLHTIVNNLQNESVKNYKKIRIIFYKEDLGHDDTERDCRKRGLDNPYAEEQQVLLKKIVHFSRNIENLCIASLPLKSLLNEKENSVEDFFYREIGLPKRRSYSLDNEELIKRFCFTREVINRYRNLIVLDLDIPCVQVLSTALASIKNIKLQKFYARNFRDQSGYTENPWLLLVAFAKSAPDLRICEIEDWNWQDMWFGRSYCGGFTRPLDNFTEDDKAVQELLKRLEGNVPGFKVILDGYYKDHLLSVEKTLLPELAKAMYVVQGKVEQIITAIHDEANNNNGIVTLNGTTFEYMIAICWWYAIITTQFFEEQLTYDVFDSIMKPSEMQEKLFGVKEFIMDSSNPPRLMSEYDKLKIRHIIIGLSGFEVQPYTKWLNTVDEINR